MAITFCRVLATTFCFIYFMDVALKYAIYFKEWVEKPAEEKLTEGAQRMFA
jgi:hypothetical protein